MVLIFWSHLFHANFFTRILLQNSQNSAHQWNNCLGKPKLWLTSHCFWITRKNHCNSHWMILLKNIKTVKVYSIKLKKGIQLFQRFIFERYQVCVPWFFSLKHNPLRKDISFINDAINTLTPNPTKWSNTFKQFAGKSRRIDWVCLTILWGCGLKVVSATFLLVCFAFLKESTCETRKNVFYFTSKALLVLEIIKF